MGQEQTEKIIKTGDLLDNESKQLVGSFLQRERLRKHFSIEEVADDTCIPIAIIRAIENNSRSKMPAPVFARGFVKLYAEFLGLESQEIVDRYNHEVDQFEDDFNDSSEVFYNEKLAESSSFISLRSCIVILFLAALCALGYYFFLYSSPTYQEYRTPFSQQQLRTLTADAGSEIANKKSLDEVDEAPAGMEKNSPLAPETAERPIMQPAPADASKFAETSEKLTEADLTPAIQHDTDNSIASDANPPAVESSSAPAVAEDLQKKIHLRIEFTERTWMQVSLDNKAPEQYLFDPADESSWLAHEKIALHIGNAGGVRLFLGDKELPVGGISGSPLRLTIPDDLASNN